MRDYKGLLSQLVQERNRLDAAIQAIEPLARGEGSGSVASRRGRRGPLSGAAKARIAAAQRARWAKWRKQQKRA